MFKRKFSEPGYLIMIVLLLLCRLWAMLIIPLNDTTEARYAEIARKMLETGNWVTLQHDYGVPFWAKPPLSVWLSAFSMKYLTVSAFAARLPDFLLSLLMLWLMAKMASRVFDRRLVWRTLLILSSSVFFFLTAGTVMTDSSLLFSLTLMMVSFWMTVEENQASWRYGFFIGAGLGLLAKGPIALVLVGMPLFFWAVLHNKWRDIWQKLPWCKGILLSLLIALPWYALAEYRTPGFLQYFIVGEHIQRFLQPGWQGDKYGFAHSSPYGMIWLFALIGSLPWSGVCLHWIFSEKRMWRKAYQVNTVLMHYLLFFIFLPLLFFSFSRNIIYPYVLPSLPAFALWFAMLSERVRLKKAHLDRWFIGLSALPLVLLSIVMLVFMLAPEKIAKSQKYVIDAWHAHGADAGENLLYWADKTDFSAQFYSAGHVLATLDEKVLFEKIRQHKLRFIVLTTATNEPLPDMIVSCLKRPEVLKTYHQTAYLYPVKLDCQWPS